MTRTQVFNFPALAGDSSAVGVELAGRLELPAEAPRAVAIFAHCFTCSKNAKAATRISRELAGRGIAVLRFDFTGLGNSEGDFSNTDFSSNVDDLVAAATALTPEFGAPSLLVGHSLGGAAVLAAASRIESVRAVITIGAPADPSHVAHLFDGHIEEIESEGSASVQLGGRPFTIKKAFLEDVRESRLLPFIESLNCALLVMHSPTDETVPIDEARKIYQGAKHPKAFVAIDGADHLLNEERDARYVASTIAVWADRHAVAVIDSDVSNDSMELDTLEAGVVRVEEQGDGFLQRVTAGRHEWWSDEPASVGGADRGPTPYDFLLAALGTCTSMTIRMYSNRKQLPLTGVRVELKHDRIHARDCEECESDTGMVDKIERRIRLDGDLDETQVTRLLEIADRCPVHRTLENEKIVRTERMG